MEDFEQQLKNALARKEQPAWFEAQVLAAATATRHHRPRFWRWAVATAVVVLIAGGSWIWHQRQVEERAAGESAKARLELGLRVAVTKLSKIQKTIRTSTEDE
jgi:hypothetical protein